jgi:hypothetical protein
MNQFITFVPAQMDCFAEPVIGRAFADPLARNHGLNPLFPAARTLALR